MATRLHTVTDDGPVERMGGFPMFRVTARLKSLSPYGPSRDPRIPKGDNESFNDHEERIFRDKAHSLSDGRVFIPPMAFKFGLTSSARFLGERIPGRGRSTWTSHFESGVLIMSPVVLPVMKDDLKGEWFFVSSKGERGGSSGRVWKKFPEIPEWEATAEFHVIDPSITEKAFARHLEAQGKFIGVGRFRPEKGGFYGRFAVMDMEWKADG